MYQITLFFEKVIYKKIIMIVNQKISNCTIFCNFCGKLQSHVCKHAIRRRSVWFKN